MIVGALIVAAGTLATLWAIAASAYWLVHPGETDPAHPKNLILRRDR